MKLHEFDYLFVEYLKTDNPLLLKNYGESLANYAEAKQKEANSFKEFANLIINFADTKINNKKI